MRSVSTTRYLALKEDLEDDRKDDDEVVEKLEWT